MPPAPFPDLIGIPADDSGDPDDGLPPGEAALQGLFWSVPAGHFDTGRFTQSGRPARAAPTAATATGAARAARRTGTEPPPGPPSPSGPLSPSFPPALVSSGLAAAGAAGRVLAHRVQVSVAFLQEAEVSTDTEFLPGARTLPGTAAHAHRGGRTPSSAGPAPDPAGGQHVPRRPGLQPAARRNHPDQLISTQPRHPRPIQADHSVMIVASSESGGTSAGSGVLSLVAKSRSRDGRCTISWARNAYPPASSKPYCSKTGKPSSSTCK
jgi:hypothetical protein